MSMRICAFIMIGALFAMAQDGAEKSMSAKLSDEFTKLVYQQSDYLSGDQYSKWLDDLRNRPGLADELWSHYRRVLDGKEEGQLEAILFALAQRPDLPREREAELIDRLDDLTRAQVAKRASLEFDLTLGLLFVLERGTDPRSELIAVRLLNSQNPDADFCVASVLRVMKRVGGSPSLEAIKAYVKRKFGDKPEKVVGYRDFAETETAIKGRLDLGKSDRGPTPLPEDKQAEPRSTWTSASAAARPSERSSGPVSLLVWLLVVVAATVGAVWVFLRKSK
jgi:hypothetical protein